MDEIWLVLDISKLELVKIFAFGFAAFLGMIAAYIIEYTKLKSPKGLWQYLWADEQAVWRAFVTLCTLCVGAGGLSYLDTLKGIDIFIAGAGIGYLVPQKTKEKL